MHARRDLLLRRASAGLFFGLLAGLIVAFLSGTFSPPFPAVAIAGCAAAAGVLAGALSALLRRTDVRRLLLAADRSLGSRELASTALELMDAPWGETFSEAVIEEAAGLMARSPPRRMLGALRLPLFPLTPVLAALIALALFFPLDIRALFAPRLPPQGELAMIGEDLESYGQRLQDAARSQNLGRSLALSQELAKLGKDLAEGAIRKDEVLDRMSDLEQRLVAEYQLRLREFQSGAPGGAGHGPGGAGDPTGKAGSGTGKAGKADSFAQSSPDDPLGNQELNDLGDALKRLRQGMGRASAPDQAGSEGGEPPSMAQGPQAAPRGPGNGVLPPGSDSQGKGQGNFPQAGGGGSALGQDSPNPGEKSPAGGPGTMPAPDTRGPPSRIAQGGKESPLKAEAVPGEGDSTKFLVRALPEWSGSRLPEDTTLRQYVQAAESALTRDEIPPRLKEYVKSYFTIIGMSTGDTRR